MANQFNVYLSGEIHSNWRARIINAIRGKGLAINCLVPELDHDASDNCGVAILGEESSSFWKDQKGAKINSIRIRTGIQQADVVIVKFGEKYKQWNAAFDAGYATALGKPLIVIHPEELTHALKEVDAASAAVASSEDQAVEILEYILRQ